MTLDSKIPLLVVTGPTASGKTRLAVDLATALDGEIIGADSMQIYKGMDIGTAKPTKEEKRGIPHHLVDFLDHDESFSVARYVEMARKSIRDVYSRGRLPVLAGGTGLYISSITDNISFDNIEHDESLRARLRAEAEKHGGEYLLERLRLCDPELAARLHPNNLGRIIRALEVFELTGETMTETQLKSRQTPSNYKLCMIGIRFSDREILYKRINERVDLMLRHGLLSEAKALYDAGFSKTASQAIGYKELWRYFNGEEGLDDAVENIKRGTRRYAKRQMTWLGRDDRISWLYADKYDKYKDLQRDALKIAEETL